MNKNTNKLEKIAIILFLLIIVGVGVYFSTKKEEQTSNIIENNKNIVEKYILK